LSVWGPSWSWMYSNWIYNYLCSQCLSQLTLWVRIPRSRGVHDKTLCDQVFLWLATGQRFTGWFASKTDRWNELKAAPLEFFG
jgi:hypothetical protein